MTTRTQVWNAVWERIKDLPSFKVTTQIVKHWDKVNAADAPFLAMQLVQSQNINQFNIPTKKSMGIDLVIYVKHGNTQGGHISPAAELMPLIDEVSAVFESNHEDLNGANCDTSCCEPTQNLGGLVSHAWIEDIVTDEGVNTAHAIAVLHLNILFT